jgi:DNA-binding MarR family transcriptional regulator/N-acetylglutamate synthase-like GNAT family acetyltransferase
MTIKSDLIRELGPLAFASRLRRLSERLMQDVSSVYADFDSDFEARWFPVAYLLKHHATLAVTEISGILGYTHPAVVQIAAAMERRGMVKSRVDAGDGRRRLLSLTARGKQTVARIAPVWDAVRRCTQEIIDGSGHDVLSVIEAVEHELDRQELLPRIRHSLRANVKVEIVSYSPSLARHFERLNREWLGHELPMEPHDRIMLTNPSTEIIAKDGQVLFSRVNGVIVGTVAILPHAPGVYEIAKMAVTKASRGGGIGRKLARAAIAWARDHDAKTILIATSPKLVRALALYRSMGFVEITPAPDWKRQYRRKTVYMKLRDTTEKSN